MTIIGFGSYTFTSGQDMDRITVPLENFEGDPEVVLQENTRYLALIDYSISNTIFQAFNAKIDYGDRLNFLAYNENSSSWFGGFTDSENLLPVIRLELKLTTVDTKDHLLPASSITVSPNPTAAEMLVQVDLESTSKARLSVTDITGKIMKNQEFENLQKEAIQLDLSDFPNGTYLVRLATETGARTMKVVVQH